jgi:type I restriction enzyme S subunit
MTEADTSSVPPGWQLARIGDLFDSWGGHTPSKANSGYWGDGIPWASSRDIKAPRLASTTYSVTQKAVKQTGLKVCPTGCVLVVMRSGILAHTLPVAVTDVPVVINQDLKAFHSAEPFMNEWLALFLRMSASALLASSRRDGTTVQSVQYPLLKNTVIPVASEQERTRIIEAVRAALAKQANALPHVIAARHAVERFRQAVLSAACSGRLTSDWQDENPEDNAGDLLEAVCSKRPPKFRDSSVRDDLDLVELPENWVWTNLRFLLSSDEAFCYGVVQPGENDPNGVYLVRAGDLNAGEIDTGALRRIPKEINDKYPRSQLRGGEVLVTVVGAGIGETAIAQPECAGYNIARAVAKLPVREFEASYVWLWLSSSRAVAWMKRDSREVARPTLNLEQLQTLPVPVPPLAEQQEIVSRVDELLRRADELQRRVEIAARCIERSSQAILAKAFRGELVSS